MIEFLLYMVKVSICWLGFIGFFQLFLKKETFFNTNRFYLLITLLVGILLPYMDFGWFHASEPGGVSGVFIPIQEGIFTVQEGLVSAARQPVTLGPLTIVLIIYFAGLVWMAVRFTAGLREIWSLYHTGIRKSVNGMTIVTSPHFHLPFSFMNVIFWSTAFEKENTEAKEILEHEISHVRGWHSLDIILSELTAIVFWCSPPVYWYRRSIKLVHEYIADNHALDQSYFKNYSKILLKQSQSGLQAALANHFFQSQLKNRLNMMLQNRSRRSNLLKYGVVLPLALFFALAFAVKSYQSDPIKEITKQLSDFFEANIDDRVNSDGYYVRYESQMADYDQLVRSLVATYGDQHDKIMEIQRDFSIRHHFPYLAENSFDEGVRMSFESKVDNMLILNDLTYTPDKLFIVDGKKFPLGTTIRDLENQIHSFKSQGMGYGSTLLSPEAAVEKYGSDAKNGAVVFESFSSEVGEIFKVVEEMPRFPGCEDLADTDARDKCAQEKMLGFIYENVTYPSKSRTDGIQGMAVAKFVIEKDGSISGLEIIRSVSPEIDEEVERVVGLMNEMDVRWIPGKQRGRLVRVQYMLPVRFRLSDETMDENPELPPAPPPPPAPTSQLGAEEIFKIVEEMPQFPGCDRVEDPKARERCSFEKMLAFVKSNLKYPEGAKAKGTQGMVVIRFVVEKDGSISNTEIIRDIGDGCGEEALRIVHSMNQLDQKWTPGKQRGRTVRVQYNLPVKFALAPSAPEAELPPPPPPPPAVTIGEEEIFKVVEEMPRFPGCEDVVKEEINYCTGKRLIEFISERIKYPEKERRAGLQGIAVVRFVVEKDGTLSTFEILKDPGEGLGNEALRVIKSMNEEGIRWIPGKQREKKVRVLYNLPVRFRLDDIPEKTENPAEMVSLDDLQVFPNPFSTELTIQFKAEAAPISLKVFDQAGREIYALELEEFNGNFRDEINTETWPSGSFSIQIIQNDKVINKLLVKN